MRTQIQIKTVWSIFLVASVFVAVTQVNAQGRYLETSEYLSAVFPLHQPDSNTVWITKEIRESAKEALGYDAISSLRVRYWQEKQRTAWILEEIGKERPITIGVVVEDDTASMVRILEFRETRGWEVRYPFFTDQFDEVSLDTRGEIDGQIDSITGATLSVEAVNRVVRLALFLYRFTGGVNEERSARS